MDPIVIDLETRSRADELPDRVLVKLRKQWAEKGEADRGALEPWTGSIVAIGMHLVRQRRTRVAYVAGRTEATPSDSRTYLPRATEAELLRELFAALASTRATPIVTWNGRSFDLPWLAFRCLAAGVKIDRQLWGDRFKLVERCDLVEVVTDFGALHKPTLDLACCALGIPSPKASGMDGAGVAELWSAGETGRIAEYCGDDVEATAEVFRRCVELGRLPEWMLARPGLPLEGAA